MVVYENQNPNQWKLTQKPNKKQNVIKLVIVLLLFYHRELRPNWSKGTMQRPKIDNNICFGFTDQVIVPHNMDPSPTSFVARAHDKPFIIDEETWLRVGSSLY